MFRLLWIASIHTRNFMRRYMPSNIILDRVRTRRGLKWGPLAMLLAIPYVAVAYWLTVLIEAGGPGLLYLFVLVCLWSAFKMLWIGPLCVISILSTCLDHDPHSEAPPGAAASESPRGLRSHDLASERGDTW